MKDIVDMIVTQVRIYPADSLPFAELRRADNSKKLKESFHFESVRFDPLGAQQMTFNNGVFEYRGKSLQVSNLTIEQRRVLIQVRGRSPMADAFYSAFVSNLRTLDGCPRTIKLEPLIKAEETACVATLDIDFNDLIAPPLLRFIQMEWRAKLGTQHGAPKSVAFKNLSFEVRYASSSPELEEHDVALSNKLITIEPRLATPLRERRFYTSSPTDSETHIAMLQALEKEVAKCHRQRNKEAAASRAE